MAAVAASAAPVPSVPDGSDDELLDPWDQPAHDPWAAPSGVASQCVTEAPTMDAASWGPTPLRFLLEGKDLLLQAKVNGFRRLASLLFFLLGGQPAAVPGLPNVYVGHPGPQLGVPPPWGMWQGGL